MSDSGIIQTHNRYGWTSTVPNQITEAALEWLTSSASPAPHVLDIGPGLGVATIRFLGLGANVIALDLDASHLAAIREEAIRLRLDGRLTTFVGEFPGNLGFEDLDAIHCSNVLHFLRGLQIEDGAAKMFRWLKPGGTIFVQVGTVYAGHIKQLLPLFNERRKVGIKWAGETDTAKELVNAQFRDATPCFMNYLDDESIIETFKSVGFSVEQGWYYTRNALPNVLRSDGRENFGLIALRPHSQ